MTATGIRVGLLMVLIALTACGRGAEPDPATTTTTTAPTTVTSSTTTIPVDPDPAFPLARLAPPPFDALAWLQATSTSAVPGYGDPPPPAQVGERQTFVYSDGFTVSDVEAELVYANDVVTMWFSDDVAYDLAEVSGAADRLAEEIIPAVTDLMGPVPAPGVDGDDRVAILHLSQLIESVGEFASYDLLPTAAFPESNQREMLYIAGDLVPGSDLHLGTIAHELTHLIDHSHRRNRPLWMAEGLAQLAERAAGFDTVFTHLRYLAYEPVQLNDWGPLQIDDRHYGSGFLVMVYLWEQYGPEAILSVLDSELEGMAAIGEAVAAQGGDLDSFMVGWIEALATDHRLPDRMSSLNLPRQCGVTTIEALPWEGSFDAPQFAPRLFNLTGAGAVNLRFAGETVIGPINDTAAAGHYVWWAGPSDESAATLTSRLDLSGVREATLRFSMWFDTGYTDSAAVMVSTDEGESWSVVGGGKATPVEIGDTFAADGYTGWSGSAKTPSWESDEVDLSAYAGEEILVRFQYTTDLYEARTGFALDEIELLQLEEVDGAENEESEWVGEGFQRVPASVDQPWVATVITSTGTERIAVDGGRAETTVDLETGQTVTVAIAATAPGTGVASGFDLHIDGDAELRALPVVGEVEGFDVPCGGWELERTPDYELIHSDGALHITTLGTEGFTWSAYNQIHDVVSVNAEMTWGQEQDGAGGIMCRLSNAGFYEVNVADDGTFLVGVADGADYGVLVEWTETSVINDGPGAFNEVLLDCGDGVIRVEINGEEVASVADDRLPPGRIALVGATYSAQRHTTTYDNVTIDTATRSYDSLVASDAFDEPSSQWRPFSDRGSRMTIEDGEYVMNVLLKDWSAETYSREIFTDVSFSTEFRITELAPDALVGAACHTSGDFDQYLFVLAFDDSFAVQAIVEGGFEEIVPWTQGAGLNIEPEALNHMELRCGEGRLFWSLNGQVLIDQADDSLTEGRIGFIAYTYDYGRLEMRLDNIIVVEGG